MRIRCSRQWFKNYITQVRSSHNSVLAYFRLKTNRFATNFKQKQCENNGAKLNFQMHTKMISGIIRMHAIDMVVRVYDLLDSRILKKNK